MPHSHRKQTIAFSSLPGLFLTIAKTLYQDTFATVSILSLTNLRNQTKDTLPYWLHETERTTLATFSYEKRHLEWLGGRICAKQVLHEYLQKKESSILLPRHHDYRIAAEESGRPYFSAITAVDFVLPELSISHSKEYATALCSQYHCGIDIQYPAESLQKVAERFATSREEKLLNDFLPNLALLSRLAMLWAGKEALKKMLSPTGMPGFQDITLQEIILKNDKGAIFIFSRNNTTQQTFPVIVGMLDSGYSLALCCNSPNS